VGGLGPQPRPPCLGLPLGSLRAVARGPEAQLVRLLRKRVRLDAGKLTATVRLDHDAPDVAGIIESSDALPPLV